MVKNIIFPPKNVRNIFKKKLVLFEIMMNGDCPMLNGIRQSHIWRTHMNTQCVVIAVHPPREHSNRPGSWRQ